MTELQQKLADDLAEHVGRIWAEVLGVEVRPDQGFFELGGHSLTALRVVYTLRAQLAVRLSLRDLMEARTLAEFVETVRRAARGETPVRAPVPLLGRRGTR